MVIAPQAPTKSDSTTYQRTAAGLLRATLGTRPDLPPETVLYEFGNPRWYDELKFPEQKGDQKSPVRQKDPGPIVFQPRAGGRARARDATSPSKSKSGASVGAAQLLSLDAAEGMERGTLWHLWCQQTRWRDETALDVSRLCLIGRPYCRKQAMLQPEAEAFLTAIERPAVKQLFLKKGVLTLRSELGAGVSVECRTESGFSLFTQGRWMTGVIDRLVLYRRDGKVVAADVIDFKTDLAGEASKLRAVYREQIRQYARAVATAYAIDAASIHSKLVWLSSGTVELVGNTTPAFAPRTAQQSLFSEDDL
jgi:ATP-dependent exoDNAse (exonuclease V) beta subunit